MKKSVVHKHEKNDNLGPGEYLLSKIRSACTESWIDVPETSAIKRLMALYLVVRGSDSGGKLPRTHSASSLFSSPFR